ncbi:MAG: beta-lactamase family protein [Chloroflexi bacterium]|nr:beta-lactamase family protein [Chloroflexota bacterium]MBP7042279.1 beta-lactamase family protein [Chloroflexota bacterium]
MNTNPSPNTLFQQLAEVIQAEMEHWHVPGVAVGIWHEGQAYMAGFGVTNIENPLPVDENTLFQIGSTTKTITTTAVLRLVEQGKLDLDAPVRAYVPDLQLADEDTAVHVTTRHLLTHTGGWAGDFFKDTGLGDDALARYVAQLVDLPQVVPLGTMWSYNNAGFSLAGRVIEAVTGQDYETAVQALVLDPLGMTQSCFFAHDAITHRVVAGHTYDDANEAVKVLRPWALARSAHSAGGVTSTVGDQLRYARFHLGDGTTEDGPRLLSPETMRSMQTPQVSANLDRQMGLSWFLNDVAGTRLVSHGGATHGQLSAFMVAPARHFAFTCLTNANRGRKLNEAVTDWVLAHYLGLAAPETPHLAMPESSLAEYAGWYEAYMSDLELVVSNGRLLLQIVPKAGFPDKDSPLEPAPPPSRLAFYQPDRVIALDPPLTGDKLEFLRDENGRILWLRTSRLHKRL